MLQTRFTKEFQDEAVRLALTSGRSRRALAADLGVGLSTLRHWIDRCREREIDDPSEDRQEDMAAELKRLPQVKGEMALHVLAYNLTRVLNILSIQPLMAALRA